MPTDMCWRHLSSLLILALLVPFAPAAAAEETVDPQDEFVPAVETTDDDADFDAAAIFGLVGTRDVSRGAYADPQGWFDAVPRVQDIRLTSSVDGSSQPSMYLPARRIGQPILVVLHSWSAEYRQKWSIPYLRYADQRDWAMVAPHFRGVNRQPTATGSPQAVADVVDAIDFAISQGGDPNRVYVVGFSGGGHMALQMAGQHPDRLAGVAAWVPVNDLNWWYGYNEQHAPWRHYIPHIEGSCGGVPRPGTAAHESCRLRSPTTHLDAARAAGLPVYIAGGLRDTIVPPSDAARAFNQLADPADRFTAQQLHEMEHFVMPSELRGDTHGRSFFGAAEFAGHGVLVARESANATFVLFDGAHEMLYEPALRWFTEGAPSGGHTPHPDRTLCQDPTTPNPLRVVPTVGYRVLDSNGTVHSYAADHHGDLTDGPAAVSMETTPSSDGYWIVDEHGEVHAFGDAVDFGDMVGTDLAAPIRRLVSTPSGDGYWLLADDGGVFSFGNARFHGSTGALDLAAPIVSMEVTPTGGGYWLVGLDGGVFAFGDAQFMGSTGAMRLDAPVMAMGATPSGYWLQGGDGGVFAFGGVGFHGSLQTLGRCELASTAQFAATPTGYGYWVATVDGQVHAFGDASWLGEPRLPLGVRLVDFAPV